LHGGCYERQVEEKLAEGFLRVARQRQEELSLLQQGVQQIKEGKEDNNGNAAEILELAQHLAKQYVTFSPPQKRQITDSVFLNLRLDDATLCADYWLPFSILAENDDHPLNSG